MKKIFLALTLCVVALTAWADEQKKVSLSADNIQQIVNTGYANLIVTLVNADGDDQQAKVLIEVENLDEQSTLLLFDRTYDERAIKGLSTSIKFDKSFGGSKGHRVIDPYSGNLNKAVILRPSTDKYSLPAFNTEADQAATVRLPFYFAKEKQGFFDKLTGSKKLVLLEKQVVELSIEAEVKPSQEYTSLKSQYDALLREVNGKTFCNNKSHRPNLDKQLDTYRKKIDALKSQIDAAINQHGWGPNDGGYRRYSQLKADIDNNIVLDSRIRDCGRHGGNGGGGHSCSYCSWSLSKIYQEMDRLYRTIYNSSNRQATKASVMAQVNALYQCCTDAGCSKHASAWGRGGNDKDRIVRCYNRIQNL